jgi:hypothetical protein
MNGEALPPITGRTTCIRTEAIDEMNVSGIGSAATATYAQSTTRRAPPPLTTTAKLLGVSTDQLTKDLQSGTTLSSLASQQGVSSSALLSSVKSDLQANAPTGSTASSSQLAQVATNLIQGGGGGHHRHGGGGLNALSLLDGTDPTTSSTSTDPTTSTSAAMSSMATLLGLSSTQVTSALQSGTSLSTLASQQGVSSSSLLSTVESDLKANAPQGAPAVSGSQLAQIATDVINGTSGASASGSSFGGGTSGGISSLGATSSTTATNNLNSLAGATGLDPSSLLSQLQPGQNLSSLLGPSSAVSRHFRSDSGFRMAWLSRFPFTRSEKL